MINKINKMNMMKKNNGNEHFEKRIAMRHVNKTADTKTNQQRREDFING